jgi:hypothetical protein
MKAYMILFGGDGWEFIDGLESKVFLQKEEAEQKLKEVRQSHIEECKAKRWADYSKRYEVVEFDLVGRWVDV